VGSLRPTTHRVVTTDEPAKVTDCGSYEASHFHRHDDPSRVPATGSDEVRGECSRSPRHELTLVLASLTFATNCELSA
jgi:hypothetical protein